MMSTSVWKNPSILWCARVHQVNKKFSSSKDGVRVMSEEKAVVSVRGKKARGRRIWMIDDRRIQCPRPLGMPFHPVVCPMLLGLLYSSSKDGVQGGSYRLGKKARGRRRNPMRSTSAWNTLPSCGVPDAPRTVVLIIERWCAG